MATVSLIAARLGHVLCVACFLLAGSAVAAGASADAGMRLGDAATPLAYDVALTIDPTRSDFSGSERIDLRLNQTASRIRLNAVNLEITAVHAEVSERHFEASVTRESDQVVALGFASELPAGEVKLYLRWRGRIEGLDTRGVFRQRDGERWYVLTQFESLSARRAMPCFDEPHWKTPWTLAISLRANEIAVSNMPAVAEEATGEGWKTVHFASTPPLPSYLVAFGVGPFEVVDGGQAGRARTPLRYIVPRGHTEEVAYAREATPRLLELLEDYFDLPFPFAKLDSLVIPQTVGFSAMENAALITYNSAAILARPEAASERFKQRYAPLAAHEIAHQWFGDAITMAWWDDLWLNESFATWMSDRIVDRFAPEWYWPLRTDEYRRRAIEVDRLPATRIVRQPVETRDDLASAFDRITYSKGGAVLATFEAWLGPERFRQGVQRYLKRHAFASATADDFFAALAEEDGRVAAAFSTFIRRPGVPLIELAEVCEQGRSRITARQKRFLPRGLEAELAAPWATPLCLRMASGEQSQSACLWIEGDEAEGWSEAASCPDFVLANPAGRAYAVVKHQPEALQRILAAGSRITPAEAISLMLDSEILARGGQLPYPEALAVAAWGAARAEVPVQAIAAEIAWRVPQAYVGDGAALASWIESEFGKTARQAGWLPREDEAPELEQLRQNLVPLVADRGRDRSLQRRARELAREELRRPGTLPAASREPVLRAAARSGERSLAAAYLAAIRRTTDRNARRELVASLGLFREAAGRLTRAALRSGRIDAREALEAIEIALNDDRTRGAWLKWIEREYHWLKRTLPEDSLGRVPRWANGACTQEERRDIARFWSPRSEESRGGKRALAQALQTIDACLAALPETSARAPLAVTQ